MTNDGVVITNVCVPHMLEVVSSVEVFASVVVGGPIVGGPIVVDVKVAVLVYHRRWLTPCKYINVNYKMKSQYIMFISLVPLCCN